MIIDIQVFEFSNTCTVRASMAVVRLMSMEALILLYGVHRSQPPADRRQAAMCSSAYQPLLADHGTSQPQAALHSVHSFLYFPIGTNVIGLLCTFYKYRKCYKQGAESLLVANWSKISHLNKRLGETCGQCRVFPALRWLHSSMLGRGVSIDSAQ